MGAVSLSGPTTIHVKLRSVFGPLAGNRTRAIHPLRVRLVNTGSADLAVRAIRIDPLREDDAGLSAPGQLSITAVERGDPIPLGGGEVLEMVLSGTVPQRAHGYVSILRVLTDGEEGLSIPVVVEVSAHPAWGIACMLLGLLVVGAVHALDTERGAEKKIHEVLLLQQQTHEFLEKHPPAESLTLSVASFDIDVAEALEILHRRRSISIEDHRIDDADERLRSAENIATELRKAERGRRAGQVEVEALHAEWVSFEAEMARMGDAAPLFPAPKGAEMQRRLQEFFGAFRKLYLLDPMKTVASDLASQLTRINLLYESGAGENGRKEAIIVRRWLRRAFREAQERGQLLAWVVVRARQIAAADAWIRGRVAIYGPGSRAGATTVPLLDQAAAALRGAWALSAFETASRLTERAHTELVRADADIMKASVAAALKASEAETSVNDVLGILKEASESSDHSPPTKATNIARMMDAWRVHIAAVDDESERHALLAHVDAVSSHVAKGDFEGAVADNHAIWDGWTAHSKRRMQQATADAIAPGCDAWRLELRRRFDDTEQSMRLLGSRPELLDWDRRLGQLRQQQLDLRSSECLDGVTALNAREGGFGP